MRCHPMCHLIESARFYGSGGFHVAFLDNDQAAFLIMTRPSGSRKELDERFLLAPLYCRIPVISESVPYKSHSSDKENTTMPHNTKTDWAKNKSHPNEIIYTHADSEVRYRKEGRCIFEIVKRDGCKPVKRLLSDREMTVKEFDMIKAFSDDCFHEEEKNNKVERKRCIPLGAVENTLAASAEMYPSTPRHKHTMKEAKALLDAMNLTPTQRRRFLLYCKGLNVDKIAALEGVSHQAVTQSLRESKAKRKKVLKNFDSDTCETAF